MKRKDWVIPNPFFDEAWKTRWAFEKTEFWWNGIFDSISRESASKIWFRQMEENAFYAAQPLIANNFLLPRKTESRLRCSFLSLIL